MMNSFPVVSVVIPLYNRPHEVKRAMKSVCAQTFKSWELIVVDDGSYPVFILSSDLSCDNVYLVRHLTNQGAAAARNTGMKNAKGKYIAFLDSDDEWLPEKLEKQIAALEKHHLKVGGCVTAVTLKSPFSKRRRYIPIKNFYQQSIKGDHFSIGSTLLFRKDCLQKVGFQNTDLKRLEDWEWQINFSKFYEWKSLPESLVTVSLGKPPPFESTRESIYILKKIMKWNNKKDYKSFNRRCLYEFFLSSFFERKYILCGWYFASLFLNSPSFLLQKLKFIVKQRIC